MKPTHAVALTVTVTRVAPSATAASGRSRRQTPPPMWTRPPSECAPVLVCVAKVMAVGTALATARRAAGALLDAGWEGSELGAMVPA